MNHQLVPIFSQSIGDAPRIEILTSLDASQVRYVRKLCDTLLTCWSAANSRMKKSRRPEL